MGETSVELKLPTSTPMQVGLDLRVKLRVSVTKRVTATDLIRTHDERVRPPPPMELTILTLGAKCGIDRIRRALWLDLEPATGAITQLAPFVSAEVFIRAADSRAGID